MLGCEWTGCPNAFLLGESPIESSVIATEGATTNDTNCTNRSRMIRGRFA